MSREEALEKIEKGLRAMDMVPAYEKITEKTRFTNDLGADSVDVIDIWLSIEQDFSTTIPDEVFSKVSTIGQVIDYLLDGKSPES